jgi:hypothetical protein
MANINIEGKGGIVTLVGEEHQQRLNGSRNGEISPIEERIKKSIEKSFDSSDFELDEVRNSSKWKSILSRAQKVASPNFYEIFYGISSHSIHGNWQDILFNHLKKENNEFLLNLDWVRPRPQIMDGVIILNLETTILFAERELNGISDKDLIIKKCELLKGYHKELVDRHEELMGR